MSVQTLFEYSRIVGRPHIEIKRRFCKHDLNIMNSGVNSLIKTSISNPYSANNRRKSIKERAKNY